MSPRVRPRLGGGTDVRTVGTGPGSTAGPDGTPAVDGAPDTGDTGDAGGAVVGGSAVPTPDSGPAAEPVVCRVDVAGGEAGPAGPPAPSLLLQAVSSRAQSAVATERRTALVMQTPHDLPPRSGAGAARRPPHGAVRSGGVRPSPRGPP
ncbi:hypothetical protein GCM10011594_20680 [Nakamurella endophytica]|uniref:Uncharacterized protein n=1 Tax=Nakamurella endophytica TaxID=1748367 RepID=A0A917WG82_9ACTN|nr:hypothetical protein GCM10011594_20680 [Nakamurella endophytica]